MSSPGTDGAGLWDYLKEAFLFRWNALLFLGGAAAAAISPMREALLPLVGAAEVLYLAGLTAAPRFRSAIDAKVRNRAREGEASAPVSGTGESEQSLTALLAGLSAQSRQRFDNLRDRCLQMQTIATGVSGRARRRRRAVEDVSSSGLDRLLWVFLRLLYLQASLTRFLDTTDGAQIEVVLKTTRTRLDEVVEGGSERLVRSLRDSLATQEVRLDNFQKAKANAEFVAVELDRLEGKIQALSEMAVNRQDPDFISREVDSVAASMHQTEAAISELSMVDGLIDDLGEAPAILNTDLSKVAEN